MKVDLGCLDGFVTEPECGEGAPSAFVKAFHHLVVAQTMRGERSLECRIMFNYESSLPSDDVFYSITIKAAVSVADEQWPIRKLLRSNAREWTTPAIDAR